MTIHLSEEIYTLLQAEARRRGKPASQLVQEHLAEWLRLPTPAAPLSAQQRSVAVLRATGLLAELSTEEQQQAAHCATTLAEVRASLDRSCGPSLSSIILEMRGPKG